MKENVSIHLIVKDGEKYIKNCLKSLQNQTYPHINFRIFDNNSSDNTLDLARQIMPDVEIIQFSENYFVSGAFNRSLKYSNDIYCMALSVDVILDEYFVEHAVNEMKKRQDKGVIQAKVFWYDKAQEKKTNIIDTTGMIIFKSRRIINRGHGLKDEGQYDKPEEIFLYEGAVPFFRRKALEDVKIIRQDDRYEYLDEDFILYAEDVDLGYRIQLAGWGCFYSPSVIAWHDRSTTHSLSGGYRSFIEQRKSIPTYKRMLDFRNQRLLFIKNDSFQLFIKHIFFIIKRDFMLFLYFIFFERTSLKAYPSIIKMTPLMMRKRKMISKNKKVKYRELLHWFE